MPGDCKTCKIQPKFYFATPIVFEGAFSTLCIASTGFLVSLIVLTSWCKLKYYDSNKKPCVRASLGVHSRMWFVSSSAVDY